MIRLATVLAALLVTAAQSANPFIVNRGVADPHVRVYNDSFYLYATSDFSPDSPTFKNTWWWIWQSPDLVDWTLRTILYPNATAATPDEFLHCWATDSMLRNGSFYFYLSLGPYEIGVMRAPTPTGPWSNALGKPLVSKNYPFNPSTQSRDPGAFADDDGKFYLVFGTFNYYIAELGDDMMSFVGEPRYVTVINSTSQNGVGILDDKPYLHKRGGTYYLSYGCFYSTSASVWGPFTYVGTWIDLNLIEPAFRTNVTNPNATQWWHNQDYNDRHGSFFSHAGQDFWSSNDRSHSTDKCNTNSYRDPILTFVHYFANGTIAPVVINGAGVGSYPPGRVEAENAMRITGARKGHDTRDSFFIDGITADTTLSYPRLQRVPARATLVVAYASNSTSRAAFLVVRDASANAELGRAPLPPTGSWEYWATARVALDLPTARERLDLELAFAGDGVLARVDSFEVV